MTTNLERENESDEKIRQFEAKIKHLSNELRLVKEEYETTSDEYYELLSQMEERVEEKTVQLKELHTILELKGRELQAMVDASPGILFYKDATQKFIRVNRKFSEIFEISIQDVIGQTFQDLFPQYTNHILADDSDIFQSGEPVLDREGILAFPKGELPILINKIPYKDIDGKVRGIIGFASDLTERRKGEEERAKLEARVRQAEKMEAMGNLAGGVAHDLNNILSSVIGFPELILADVPEDSPLRAPLQIIKDSGERASQVVQDLLTLARRGVSVREVVNANEILSDLLKSPEFDQLKWNNPEVEVEVVLETDLLNILGSPVHLSKAVMNLVLNAVESMSEGGKLALSTENRYLDRPIQGYDDVEEGDYVAVNVADTGTGISPEDIERIFEPFYTKKRMGRSGTGLGMTVVWGTMKDHNGYIDVQSKVGEGAILTLYFPATQQKASRNRSGLSIEDYKGEGESVLVVDDVEEQQKLASAILTKLGYSVTTVSSGEEAVEYLQNSAVDLLVLDMIMDPGMDGLDTFRCILEQHPGQKAIIVSGFSETGRVEEAQRLGAGAYVRKPYLMEKLGMAVRTELDNDRLP